MNPKRYARLLVLLAVAAVSAAVIAPAAQAATPAPGYGQFAGCPTKAEDPTVSSCLHAVISSGRLKLGNKDTPITNPIVISGGTNAELGEFRANAEGGLKPARQKVPGGVVGLTGLTWLLELLGSEALTLYATAEAAGLPTFEGITKVTLPLRIHLENGTLGNNCYVGSFTNPVVLHLTTGTSGSLTGKKGTLTFDETTEILKMTNAKYVDGLFTAPGASGCVLTLFGFIPISINGLVNTASGLPASSGTNETEQITTTENASVELVYP
ncbi:MAG TPA: hypothetical protein VGI73_08010 [Solirubrobacterales bacterium]|jgi:hypothetical protein